MNLRENLRNDCLILWYYWIFSTKLSSQRYPPSFRCLSNYKILLNSMQNLLEEVGFPFELSLEFYDISTPYNHSCYFPVYYENVSNQRYQWRNWKKRVLTLNVEYFLFIETCRVRKSSVGQDFSLQLCV